MNNIYKYEYIVCRVSIHAVSTIRLSGLIDARVSPCESCRSSPTISSPIWTCFLRFDCFKKYIARIYIEKDGLSFVEYFWKLEYT